MELLQMTIVIEKYQWIRFLHDIIYVIGEKNKIVGLVWWNNLHDYDKQKNWIDMKVLIREEYVSSYHSLSSKISATIYFDLHMLYWRGIARSLLMVRLATTMLVLRWFKSFA
jgi:hypothetical protein